MKQFKTESKRILDLMINSIYTHKEIFLRELISNASDAIDKLYFRSLTDTSIHIGKDDYAISIIINKEEKTLTISDNGCGMTKEELENNLLEMVKQKEAADRTLLALEWVVGILSCVVIFVPVFIGALLPMEDWMRLVVVFSGFIPGIIGFLYAVKIEQIAGYYECGHCKHTYVPTYRSVSFAQHRGRTRYMRCPKCNKKSWQKKVLSKNK